MRRGEVLGLEWSDIDFKKGFANITKARQYTSEKGILLKKKDVAIYGITQTDYLLL